MDSSDCVAVRSKERDPDIDCPLAVKPAAWQSRWYVGRTEEQVARASFLLHDFLGYPVTLKIVTLIGPALTACVGYTTSVIRRTK